MKKSLLRKIIRSTIIESFIKEGHCYDEDGNPKDIEFEKCGSKCKAFTKCSTL